jgi:hypothetical protein
MYAVKFHKGREEVVVVVDDWVPCVPAGRGWRPIFARSRQDNERYDTIIIII